jgi:hypothetical protein
MEQEKEEEKRKKIQNENLFIKISSDNFLSEKDNQNLKGKIKK